MAREDLRKASQWQCGLQLLSDARLLAFYRRLNGLRFGVLSLGFGVYGLGFRVWGVRFRVLRFWGLRFGVLGFRVQGLRFGVLGFRVWYAKSRAYGKN